MGLRIKKGDMVKRISGDRLKERNRSIVGEVLEVNPKKGTAIVEGMNLASKHERARSQDQPGGIMEKEMPIDLSNLMLVEPTGEHRAGRFSIEVDENGNKVRVLKIKEDNGEITKVRLDG